MRKKYVFGVKKVMWVVLCATTAAILAPVFYFSPAEAESLVETEHSGFLPSKNPLRTTAKAASELPHGTRVLLRGRIVGHIRTHYYTFRDMSGEIALDIENNRWRGLVVTPEDHVEVEGEIYIGFRGLRVEVQHLRILESPMSADIAPETLPPEIAVL